MAKAKYKFNPDSLSFDKVRLGVKALILRFFAYFVGSVLLAAVYGLVFMYLVDSPEEKALKNELAHMQLQYELVNRELDNLDKVLDYLQQTDDNIYRTIFEAEPIPASLRAGGIGGVNRYADLEGFTNSDLIIETAKRLDKIRKKAYVQSKSFDDLIVLAKEKEDMLRCIPAIQPISNRDLTRTASGWGLRIHPIYKIIRFHQGIDFTAPTGTEIYATGDGKVLEVKSMRRDYGNHIIIDHGYGYTTVYAHLDRFNVKKGQVVKRGDVIGFVGSTGLSTAPHLHYEVKLNNRNVDPANYFFNDLTPEEYERLIEIAARTGRTLD
jgi:murein DD-endopeptidase MepM/ murein hydrolase activator NlpD